MNRMRGNFMYHKSYNIKQKATNNRSWLFESGRRTWYVGLHVLLAARRALRALMFLDTFLAVMLGREIDRRVEPGHVSESLHRGPHGDRLSELRTSAV